MKVDQNLEEVLLETKEELPSAGKDEHNNKNRHIKEEYFAKQHYLFSRNPIEVLLFSWISPLLRYGYRFDLDQKSIPHLREIDKPKVDFNKLSQTLEKNWQTNKSGRQGMTLTKSLFKAFRKEFTLIFILAILISALQMYKPILSHDIIQYLASGDTTIKQGVIFFLLILAVSLFLAISQTFLWYYFAILGYNLSNTLSLLIYNKALKHPLVTQKQFAIADIINYSQVDSQRMTSMGFQLISLLIVPFQIITGFILLYNYIGVSFLVGLGVMIILMLLTLVFTKIAATGNDKLLKAKDARMKATEEMLQIIKYIKVNALEKYFFRKINQKRQDELKLIRRVNLCYVISIFLYWLCPPMIISFTFLAYIGLGNQISASKAFFTIIIFNILQYPIRMLPSAISQIIQIWSSIKRIEKFLFSIELKKDFIVEQSEKQNGFAIQIQRGYFLWGKEKQKDKDEKKGQQKQKDIEKDNSLKNVKKQSNKRQSKTQILSASVSINSEGGEQKLKQSLLSQNQQKSEAAEDSKDEKYIKVLNGIDVKIPAQQVTMIIGDIGSGKSSLLYAILNQMTPEAQKNPVIRIRGSLAYSAQKAWIMAGTVKDNIIFYKPFDQKRFKQAIYYSCLEDDLKILNKGVETEIGEKGTNLSGGQKARISLARALYSNKDIYLLDDILSAVDVHVGKFIMQKTILEYLKGKTILMPTHAVKYLQYADNIIIMDKGKIVASGNYRDVNDCIEFQQIMKIEQKKSQQKQKQSNNKQQQAIINDLKLVKEATKSKENKMVEVKNIQITDQIVEQLVLAQDHKKGEVSLDVYLQYIKFNGGPLFIIAVVLCLTIWATLSIYSNIQIQQWCEDQAKSKLYLYLYLSFGISATFFSGARAFILVMSGIKQGRTVHKKMIKSLLYASITKFYNRVPIGRILNRLSKDLRQLDEAIGYAVGGTFISLFCLISSLIMCVYASTMYVLIPIVLLAIIARVFLKYYLKSQRQCVRLENISQSPIVSGFTSAVNGVATIRAYGLQVQFLNQQIQRVDINKRTRISRQAMESWYSLRMAFFSFMVNMSALAFCIFSNQKASLAGLLLTYAGLLSDDIISFGFSYANMELRMISIERIITFSKLEPEIGYSQYCKGWRTREQGYNLNEISQGNIEFINYSARYRDGLPLVIKDICVKIKKGEKVGIVGRTGAGKSTLINCLLRIIEPAEGTILIDGKKITQYKLKDLRSCITMIQQEPTLINGSFRQNLDPAGLYSDQQIREVLKKCNLADLVEIKGGLDAKATNQNLSVGERQLLCICRAFMKKSRIILIDEATANIDVKNDKLIQEMIISVFKESTVLTIAHRLSTLQNSDKVMVLNEGKVVEWGDRKTLLNKQDGIYRRMCDQNDSTYLL